MDRFLTRSSSFGSLNSKRPADDNIDGWRTPKRYAQQKKFDDSRNLSTSNKFQGLPVDSENDSSNKRYFEATTKIKKTGHIPPIIVDIKNRTHENIKEAVALIFGVTGACRRQELTNISVREPWPDAFSKDTYHEK